MKLYIIVKQSLSTGLKCAQACHAMHAFTQAYPDLTEAWEPSNNVVVLQEEDVQGLAQRLEHEGFTLIRFHEPDMDDTLTAICVEPSARKSLARLKLAA